MHAGSLSTLGNVKKSIMECKRESPNAEPQSPLSSKLSTRQTLGARLCTTRLACEEVCKKVQHLHDEHGSLVREQQAHIANLQAMSNQQHQENEFLQAKLQEQQINYNLVIGDMFRICDEKQRILEQRDEERFEKEFNNMILAQYRDEIAEKRKIIKAKDTEIGALAEESTRLKAELYSLQNRRPHYDSCIEKAPSGGEMDGGSVMQRNLDVPTLKRSKRRRRRNGRKVAC